MISIQRPARAPETLRMRGQKAREALERAVLDHPERRAPIDSKIYTASDVKQALKDMQHHKCAFCEAKITHIDDGDVEHFRPKQGWKQKPGDSLQRPGYYWLAYEWSNLLLACTRCNQRHKGNLFPLAVPSGRVRDPHGALAAEQPMFIDPSAEDPAEHLTFDRWDPAPVMDSERGRVTIAALGLDRRELREHRRDRYKKLEIIHRFVQTARNGFAVSLQLNMAAAITDALGILEAAVLPKAEYSAMARALLRPR